MLRFIIFFNGYSSFPCAADHLNKNIFKKIKTAYAFCDLSPNASSPSLQIHFQVAAIMISKYLILKVLKKMNLTAVYA